MRRHDFIYGFSVGTLVDLLSILATAFKNPSSCPDMLWTRVVLAILADLRL